MKPGCEIPISRIPASIALDYATVFALGADNDTFSLTVTLSVDDPCRTALRTPDYFETFLHAVPHSEPWIRAGMPISDVETLSRIENRRGAAHQSNARTWDLDGLDACPTSRRRDAARARRSGGLRPRLLGMDRRSSRRLVRHSGRCGRHDDRPARSGNLGERFEPAETPASRFAAAAFQCAAHDETLGAAVARVAHLFAPPAEAFGDPDRFACQRVRRRRAFCGSPAGRSEPQGLRVPRHRLTVPRDDCQAAALRRRGSRAIT